MNAAHGVKGCLPAEFLFDLIFVSFLFLPFVMEMFKSLVVIMLLSILFFIADHSYELS